MKSDLKFATNSIVFLLLWLFRQFDVGDAVKYDNVTRLLNTDVTLECDSSYDADVRWQYFRGKCESHSHTADTVYQTGNVFAQFRGRFQAQNVTEKRLHLLKISNVQHNDSGCYICCEKNGECDYPYPIYLTVVDSLPEPPPLNKGNIIIIASVAAFVAVVLITFIIVGIWKHRRRQSSKCDTSMTVDSIDTPVPVPCTDESSTIQAIRPSEPENRDWETPANRGPIDTPDHGEKNDSDNNVKSIIRNLQGDLEYLMEFHGLIAKIRNRLPEKQVIELHRRKKTVYEQISQLLECVTDLPESDCVYFLKALEETGQKHVANYIRQNGTNQVMNAAAAAELMSDLNDDERTLEYTMMANLLTYIVSSEADITKLKTIVAELEECKSITRHQKDYIDRSDGLREKHERLVEVLTRRTVADFNRFIELLNKYGNHHLAELLDGKRDELEREQHDGPLDQTDGPFDQTDSSIPLLPTVGKDKILAILRSHFPRIIDSEDDDPSDA